MIRARKETPSIALSIPLNILDHRFTHYILFKCGHVTFAAVTQTHILPTYLGSFIFVVVLLLLLPCSICVSVFAVNKSLFMSIWKIIYLSAGDCMSSILLNMS